MSPRVLLADDSDDIREITCMSLERVGDCTVVSVSSGQAALDAASSDGPFDAVLLDVMMPGMDGPCTLRALRERGLPAEVPIIFLTAKTQAADLEHLSSLGAAGVLNKPFDPITLPDELQRFLPN
jgi:two-component system OmpR family response regulator